MLSSLSRMGCSAGSSGRRYKGLSVILPNRELSSFRLLVVVVEAVRESYIGRRGRFGFVRRSGKVTSAVLWFHPTSA